MKYIKTPNLPDKKVRAVIADYRINPQSVQTLNNLGIEVIYSAPVEALYDAVKGHPDMQIHHLGENRFVCADEVYDYYTKALPENAELIRGTKLLRDKYPEDVLYNAAVVGECLVCNKKYTAPEIISRYEKIIDVKQGYAKCSIAVINERAVITYDKGIGNVLKKEGIEVLLINPGEIRLDGVSCGFIGGACGLIAPDVLAVNGNIKKHSDGEKIEKFCHKHNVKILELNGGDLYDIGSILPIY